MSPMSEQPRAARARSDTGRWSASQSRTPGPRRLVQRSRARSPLVAETRTSPRGMSKSAVRATTPTRRQAPSRTGGGRCPRRRMAACTSCRNCVPLGKFHSSRTYQPVDHERASQPQGKAKGTIQDSLACLDATVNHGFADGERIVVAPGLITLTQPRGGGRR